MRELNEFFIRNEKWALSKIKEDPDFFLKQSGGQSPKYLWLGCSDSRVSESEIMGLKQGEIFVHRNIANLFIHTDFNCLSVLQFAVDYLEIEHIIVCGHYGCGGIAAAMENKQFGLVDNWLRCIRDVHSREKEEMDLILDPEKKYKRLVELNVLHQAMNVCHTTIVHNAWAKRKKLVIHGWVYDVSNGLLKDLNCCISSIDQIDDIYRTHKLHAHRKFAW